MRRAVELSVRLIEADVAVVTDSEQLQIHSAERFYLRLIARTFLVRIRFHSIWDIDILKINIDLVKQMLRHEVKIALVVRLVEPFIFIQIYSSNF